MLITAMSDETDRIVGLELGADDYLTKPFNPRELLARIKAILRRSENNPPQKKEIKFYYFDGFKLDIQKREISNENNETTPLSTAEYELLLTFLQKPQTTLSRDLLLDLARGRESQVFDRSIDTLISRLRKKIKKTDNSDIIKTVWGGGYCLISEVTHD